MLALYSGKLLHVYTYSPIVRVPYTYACTSPLQIYIQSHLYLKILCNFCMITVSGPLCDNLCFNGGTCDSSGRCVCAAGFTGPSCNTGLCMHACMHTVVASKGLPYISLCNKLTLNAAHSCLVICTPACRNGGKCQWNASSSTAECDCPVDTTGSYCQHKGTCNLGNACMLTAVEVHELPPCISFLQRSVTQVAKMEEFAIIVYIIIIISVTVPLALLDPTARTKVRATRNMHANNR